MWFRCVFGVSLGTHVWYEPSLTISRSHESDEQIIKAFCRFDTPKPQKTHIKNFHGNAESARVEFVSFSVSPYLKLRTRHRVPPPGTVQENVQTQQSQELLFFFSPSAAKYKRWP